MKTNKITRNPSNIRVKINENNIDYFQHLRGSYGLSYSETAMIVAKGHVPFTISMNYNIN